MNTVRRTVVVLGALGLVIMALFPPWVLRINLPDAQAHVSAHPLPYAWIGQPPLTESEGMCHFRSELCSVAIDFPRLGLQVAALLALCCAAGVVVGLRKPAPMASGYRRRIRDPIKAAEHLEQAAGRVEIPAELAEQMSRAARLLRKTADLPGKAD